MAEVERFDVHVTPGKGRSLVLGASMAGGAAVLAGLLLSEPILVVVALAAFAVALYNYPLLDRTEAHLTATLHGLSIDGLGIVDWKSIDALTLSDDQNTPTLLCTLNQTLEGSLKEADETSALRTVQVNIWRLEGGATLAIDLSQVDEPAVEICHALQGFHARAKAGF